MLKPVIQARVEKANNFAGFRINSFRCGGLVGITVPAGKCQILTYREATMRLGRDMFNFKVDGAQWFLPPAADCVSQIVYEANSV